MPASQGKTLLKFLFYIVSISLIVWGWKTDTIDFFSWTARVYAFWLGIAILSAIMWALGPLNSPKWPLVAWLWAALLLVDAWFIWRMSGHGNLWYAVATTVLVIPSGFGIGMLVLTVEKYKRKK
ncbi:hypothetical protein AAG747_18370 [Rapidithrix thailandica]|uniref:Uncharacterized protein n=1 Tax=Rapidithrix thailandica TaxID=413964 RepID=A0AAW9SGA2_9BACT